MIAWTHGSLRSEASTSCRVHQTTRTFEPSTQPACIRTGSLLPSHERPSRPLEAGSERRHIALVTGNYLTVTDGVSRTLHRLVDHLKKCGHRVLVLGPSSPSTRGCVPDELEYVPVPSFPMPGRREYRLAVGMLGCVARRLAVFSPDLVHVATPDLLGRGALEWARSRSIPVVSSYHTHFPAYLRFYGLSPLKSPLERYLRWFYGRCRHVYVPTLPLMAYLRELGVNGSLRPWGRGVDRSAFSPHWRSISWRRQLGLGADDVLVTFVGRLVREKSLDVYASVVRELGSKGVRSMIVGDGPLRRSLEEQLPECHFTGHLEGVDLARAYASSDVFLFPSESEAFGNVMIEAMASGLPVVCAESPCSMHVLHGRTGLIAPAGDKTAFIEHTRYLAERPSERRRMAVQARRRAARYDWERTLSRMMQYYEEVWIADVPGGCSCDSAEDN